MLRPIHRTALLVGMAGTAVLGAGCGEFVRQGQGPVLAVVTMVEGASGADPTRFGGTLGSDVLTMVKKDLNGVKELVPTVFTDIGRANITVTLKDPGTAGSPARPTAMNAVTFTRYRVVYVRADGRNTPGVDVPYPFDSSATFTAVVGAPGAVGFEIVRLTAKQEAPLRALITNSTFISTIAEITFYGQDAAGNDVSATGSIGITFGNFGDPE
jgi:hypothetical protein